MSKTSYEDAHGNLYEEDIAKQRHQPGAGARRAAATSAAAEGIAAGKEAAKTIEAGGKAALDHGASGGAGNLLKFHAWQQGEDID